MPQAAPDKPAPAPPQGAARWLLLAILAGLCLRLLFMAVSAQQAPVTSDEAMVVLQAKSIAQGERPLLFYGQPYQFPLAAYLSAPLVGSLPRSALGARWLPFGLGLASFLLLVHLTRRLGPRELTWPAALLIALPSSYLLTMQAGYAVPSYDMMLALWSLALWLALVQRAREGVAGALLAGAAGLVSGLAFSVHPLALSLLAPLGLFVCLDQSWRRALAKTPAYLLGLLLGLLPFLLVEVLHPDASAQVAGRRALASILSWDFASATGHAISGALGFFACAFPDLGEDIHLPPWLETPLLWLFLLALAAASLASLRGMLARARQGGWPGLEPLDIFPWACWLGLAMFTVNERSNSGQFRYLLILPWCLPFLAARLLPPGRGWARRGVALAVVALALFNLLAGANLLARWSRPGYLAAQAQTPDLTPVIRVLDREGVGHCYAAHWTAARLTFLTDERIICDQPINERFGDWPLPRKDKVDQAERAAYALMTPDSFDALDFELALAKAGVRAREIKAGVHHVYLDFRWPPELEGRRTPPRDLAITASHAPREAAGLGEPTGGLVWSGGREGEGGGWLEIGLPRPMPLNRLLLRHARREPAPPPLTYRLWARQEGVWQEVRPAAAAAWDDFEMPGGHPLWGRPTQSLTFPPVLADALRLELGRQRGGPSWGLAGVEVYYIPRPD